MKIPNIDSISVSSSEFLEIMKCPVGYGTEGVVYQFSPQLVIKVYYPELYSLKENLTFLEDTKVIEELSKVSFIKQKEKTFYCQNEEGVRLRNEYAVLEAKRRQERIASTPLPLAPFFVDGRFRGIVLYYFRHATSIYNYKSLPKKCKRNIFLRLLAQCDELTANYIYPTDFTLLQVTNFNKGNVLVDYRLRPHIVDLGGHSAFYCSCFDSNYYSSYLYSLNSLFCDFWWDNTFLAKDPIREDFDYYKEKFESLGISQEISESLAHGECSANELRRILMM